MATDLAPNESVEKSYPYDIRVIRVDREDEPPLYRFEAPGFVETMEWKDKDAALMYAAVYVAVDGFREEKTGERGIPPEVERDGREAVVAYLTTQRGMSTKWVTRFYDIPAQRVYEYKSRIRARAEDA